MIESIFQIRLVSESIVPSIPSAIKKAGERAFLSYHFRPRSLTLPSLCGQEFKAGKSPIMLATDVAARGLGAPSLATVRSPPPPPPRCLATAFPACLALCCLGCELFAHLLAFASAMWAASCNSLHHGGRPCVPPLPLVGCSQVNTVRPRRVGLSPARCTAFAPRAFAGMLSQVPCEGGDCGDCL